LVHWAVDGLRKLQPNEPISFKTAIKLGKREIGIKDGKAKAGPGRGKKTGYDVTRFKRGNKSEYLTARIERDHPKILDQLYSGKFKSVRAAAIEAGIVKPPCLARNFGLLSSSLRHEGFYGLFKIDLTRR